MAKSLHFQIATPERIVFDAASVEQLTLPTKTGEITILPDHIPLVSSLVAGEIRVKIKGEEVTMAVSGGFIEVRPGKIVVLADNAERAEEIAIKRAEEARERAKQLMDAKHHEAEDYAGLSAKLERELARLKVAHKYRERKSIGMRVQE